MMMRDTRFGLEWRIRGEASLTSLSSNQPLVSILTLYESANPVGSCDFKFLSASKFSATRVACILTRPSRMKQRDIQRNKARCTYCARGSGEDSATRVTTCRGTAACRSGWITKACDVMSTPHHRPHGKQGGSTFDTWSAHPPTIAAPLTWLPPTPTMFMHRRFCTPGKLWQFLLKVCRPKADTSSIGHDLDNVEVNAQQRSSTSLSPGNNENTSVLKSG